MRHVTRREVSSHVTSTQTCEQKATQVAPTHSPLPCHHHLRLHWSTALHTCNTPQSIITHAALHAGTQNAQNDQKHNNNHYHHRRRRRQCHRCGHHHHHHHDHHHHHHHHHHHQKALTTKTDTAPKIPRGSGESIRHVLTLMKTYR